MLICIFAIPWAVAKFAPVRKMGPDITIAYSLWLCVFIDLFLYGSLFMEPTKYSTIIRSRINSKRAG